MPHKPGCLVICSDLICLEEEAAFEGSLVLKPNMKSQADSGKLRSESKCVGES